MAEKEMKARIVLKHDTETNWKKATNFTPKKSELIIYDKDDNYNYARIKIGDGTTNVNNLPFMNGVGQYHVDGGEIFNDYMYNTASAEHSSARGTMVTASGIAASAEGKGLVASTEKYLGISISTLSINIASVNGNTITTSSVIGLDTILSNIGISNGFIIKVGGHLIPIKSYTSSGTILKTITMVSFNDTVDASIVGQKIDDLYLGVAAGDYSHHEGNKNLVLAPAGHAEGEFNVITPRATAGHAQGSSNIVDAPNGDASGESNEVTGQAGSVRGLRNKVKNIAGDASGVDNIVDGVGGVVMGKGNHGKGHYTLVRGKYAIEDPTEPDENGDYGFGEFVDMVGNGTDDNNRSIAYALDWKGNAVFQGKVYVDNYEKEVSTTEDIDKLRQNVESQISTVDTKVMTNRAELENLKVHHKDYADNLYINAKNLINTVDTKVTNSRKMAGNAIVNTKTTDEEELFVGDISPFSHDVTIKLSGTRTLENLIEFPSPKTVTTNGITFNLDSSGIIHILGTATDNAVFIIQQNFNTIAGNTYKMSGFSTQGISGDSEVWMYLRNAEDTNNYLGISYPAAENTHKIFYKAETNASTRIQITVRKGMTMDTYFKPCISLAPTAFINNGDEMETDEDGFIRNVPSTYPYFTVSSQKGATISVTYHQDTEKAIDRKLRSERDRLLSISLPANKWVQDGEIYSQKVNINGITFHSRVDLQPLITQYISLGEDRLTFQAVNEDMVVTIYSIGGVPSSDLIIQASITEVELI